MSCGRIFSHIKCSPWQPLWLMNYHQHKPPWVDKSGIPNHHHHHHHHHILVDSQLLAPHRHNYPSPLSAQQQSEGWPCTSSFGRREGLHDSNDDDELLLRTLCEKGQLDIALDMLYGMDTAPSTNSYLALLKACVKGKALNQAKRVHAHLTFHRVPLSGILGDYLVVALAKCGAIEDAHQISDRLPRRTVFSWNAMISACVEFGHRKEALKMHQCMQQDGVEPDIYTYVSLFKACGSIMDVGLGRKLHADARKEGFTSSVFVGSTLISMYGKGGAVAEAEAVFIELFQRNVVSWNAMLSAYLEHGQGEKAIRLYRQMLEEGVSADQHTLVFALQACCTLANNEEGLAAEGPSTKLMSLEIGHAAHSAARRKGFALNVFVGTTLLSMYSKCGAIAEAENVFSALSQRNIVSWNAMLSAYVEHCQGEKALSLYRQLQQEGLRPYELTYVMSLQACSILAESEETCIIEGQSIKVTSLEIGQALHVDARTKGLASDCFVGTALLSMYGKCGAIVEAEDVFSTLSEHDVVAWNAMLSTYIEQGKGVKALQTYRQMCEKGMSPYQITLVLALQACGTLGDKEEVLFLNEQSTKLISFEIGQALHADALRKGFSSDMIVGNTLVSMYGKCGAIVEAEQMCDASPQRNVVTWNAILSTYVEHRQGERALQSYTQLLKEGVNPDQLTFVMVLQACGILAEKEESLVVEGRSTKVISLQIGQALHTDACMKGFASYVFVGTALLSMYGKCGAIVEAENIFGALPLRDVVSWNALLSAYIEQGQGEKALQLYRQMQQEGPRSYQLTLMMALQACATLAEKEKPLLLKGQSTKMMSLELGRALHADASREGYASDIFVGNMLVSMYGKCGAVVKAEDVFGALSHRDVVSWNVLLSICVQQGQGEKALRMYREIQKQHVTLDDVTLTCILQACSSTGSLEICKQLHFDGVSAGYDQTSSVAVTLIHAYGSCASMGDAQAFFDELPEPDIMSWNACISGNAGEGSPITSLKMFERLKMAGIKPDEATFTSVLSACSHSGLVVKGLEYFESMSRDDGITPDLKHYGSMVDLLGRAGDFKRLENMMGRLPMQANLAIWLCLLGACRTHSNLELGKEAFDNAVNMQPEHTTAYVMMSNMYADAGL